MGDRTPFSSSILAGWEIRARICRALALGGHFFARFSAGATRVNARVHLAHTFAIVSAAAANFSTDATGQLVQFRAGQHEIRAGLANFRTVEHEPEVVRFYMFASGLKAVIHRHFQANTVALLAVLNAFFHLRVSGVSLHGGGFELLSGIACRNIPLRSARARSQRGRITRIVPWRAALASCIEGPVKRVTPPKPEFLLREFADAGAALTLHPDGHSHTVVISPALMIKANDLFYHAVDEQLPKGMHHLHFDGMVVVDELHIDFLRDGHRAASLCPVEVDGQKSLQIWTLWNHWQAEHEAEYYAEVTAALRECDEDAE